MKPMLAAPTDGKDLAYPLLASPKLDGVRALVLGGVVVSRKLKPIPNKHVQRMFGLAKLEGLDGELIVGEPTHPDVFRSTTSSVMSAEGEPDVVFHVFDRVGSSQPFTQRLASAGKVKHGGVKHVVHTVVESEAQLLELEQSLLAAGYEGVMLRHPDGPYKHGRSTLRESWLLKLKRFADGEARIVGFQELMHNANEAKTNELGVRERSHCKAGMEGRGVLGAVSVREAKTGVVFDIGSGFTQADREAFWANRAALLGAVVKYRFFPTGSKEKPRFPVFAGFRDEIDL